MGGARFDDYWSRVARHKTFSHPLHDPWLERFVPRTACVLDWGCGYGRILAELRERGYEHALGIDSAPGMLARARAEHEGLDVHPLEAVDALGSFDAVLLFAVLTCVPDDDALERLVAGVHGALRPGGVVYVSDMLLQTDARCRERYGTFALDGGLEVRHFSPARVRKLLTGHAGLREEAWRELEVVTMNGNPARAFQTIARKPA